MASTPLPEGIFSYLDTDLYKLTMQCAIFKFFSKVHVEYKFTNRTPHMRLDKKAFAWLQEQIARLENIALSDDEYQFLKEECKFLTEDYLSFLKNFRLRPKEHLKVAFTPVDDTEYGDLDIHTEGLWLDTILYEIPLLALTSEAYFKFCDKDWDHQGQEEKAYNKGKTLFKAGCLVSEFGSRRRRDQHTQNLVVEGLVKASEDAQKEGHSGKLTGTSNVYFAKKYGIPPVGTVAHEWYMGIAALTDDYEDANELGLRYWHSCFGQGVLGIALTDTFGTPAFFEAFKKRVPLADKLPRDSDVLELIRTESRGDRTYAEVFTGVRQDSGDPKEYVKLAGDFYKSQGITGKTIVFSDSLNTERCIEYKGVAEAHGLKPSFGVGTFFTNDFMHKSDGTTKSKPLNIVIKISKAGGRPAVKISDDIGKNTGESETVQSVKARLGYSEHRWFGVEENNRW